MKIRLNILISVLIIANLNASHMQEITDKMIKREVDRTLNRAIGVPDIQNIISQYSAKWRHYKALNAESAVYDLDFSPNSKYLASGSINGNVRTWDISSDKELHNFNFTEPIESVAYSHDGQYLAASSRNRDNYVKIINTDTNKEIKNFSVISPKSLAFSPDDKQLGVASYADDTIKILNFDTGKVLHSLQHNAQVNYLKYFYNNLKMSSNLHLIAGSPKDIKIWNPNTGTLIKDLVNKEYMRAMTFYKNKIAYQTVGEIISEIKILNIDSGKYEHSIPVENTDINDFLAYSPDGKFLAFSSGGDITLLNTVTYEEFQTLVPRYPITSLAFSPDSKFLAAGQSGGIIDIWQLV